MRIADLLLSGESNAVPMSDLVAATGLDSRDIRKMIQLERLAGAAICSNNSTGYFLAETDEERTRFVQSMRGRAGEINRVADAVERGGD